MGSRSKAREAKDVADAELEQATVATGSIGAKPASGGCSGSSRSSDTFGALTKRRTSDSPLCISHIDSGGGPPRPGGPGELMPFRSSKAGRTAGEEDLPKVL